MERPMCAEDSAYARSATLRVNLCLAIPMEPQGDVFAFVPTDPISRLLLSLFELMWRLAAGFANGLAAGYISHLALDAATPRSIPLLKAGF
jgi:hypothetical protein